MTIPEASNDQYLTLRDFRRLVWWFRYYRYRVKVEYRNGERRATVRGRKVVAFFQYGDGAYLRNRLIADNKHSFNKWSDTALVMKHPVNITHLFTALRLLATDEAAEYSNRFGFWGDGPKMFPREV